MLKNEGRERQSKNSKKKYRDVKCINCGKKIHISDYIENEDYDVIGENKINIYCDECGQSQEVKL